MARERSIRRYRRWYAKLLRLHSRPFRERFGEGMEQTFCDVLRERAAGGGGIFGCALWMFVETSAGITRENERLMVAIKATLYRSVVGLALAAPFVLHLLTSDVRARGAGDLVKGMPLAVLAAILIGAVVAFKETRTRNAPYRLAVALGLATAFMLFWANGAVGLIGSEDNPANLLYVGVPVVGIIGALVTRFRADGMARAMFATAVAQALVPVIALMIWRPPVGLGVLLVFVGNAFFVALFVGAALLFRRADAAGAGAKG